MVSSQNPRLVTSFFVRFFWTNPVISLVWRTNSQEWNGAPYQGASKHVCWICRSLTRLTLPWFFLSCCSSQFRSFYQNSASMSHVAFCLGFVTGYQSLFAFSQRRIGGCESGTSCTMPGLELDDNRIFKMSRVKPTKMVFFSTESRVILWWFM